MFTLILGANSAAKDTVKPSIAALVAASSLLLPLIYTFIFLIKNQINPPNKNYQANSTLIIIVKETIS